MNADAETTADLDPSLVEWIRGVTGARHVRVERRSAGASRAGYAVDVQLADGTDLPLWLRRDTGAGPQSSSVYTLRREAAVYRALQGRGVKIAAAVAESPDGSALLMQRLDGDNWFSRIRNPQEAETLAIQFMQQLAALHDINPSTLDLPELGPLRSVREHVADEIDIWDAQYRDQREPEPLLELALSWLRAHLPDDGGEPVVLVQGDTGPGNFMYRGDQLVAVTDWEMAHWGDRHDDLAWIYVRDLQEPFTHLPDRVRDYERFSGRRIDPARLRYFLVLAQTRCAIGTRNGLLARDSRGEIANHLIYSTLHMRALAEALAAAAGVGATPDLDVERLGDTVGETHGGDDTWIYDVALDDLRHHIVPALGDGFATARAKGLARLIKYLRERDRLGDVVDREELRLLRGLLGDHVTDRLAGQAEVCERIRDGSVDEAAVVELCLHQQALRTHVMRAAMGALADRHHAAIP
ncbi:MAG TPA: phosphotransferase family protein [Acidimicrobiales bacterium]